jgi:hypothetical protein
MARLPVERAVKVTETHRQWWRDRFSREEIAEMADALFGEHQGVHAVSKPGTAVTPDPRFQAISAWSGTLERPIRGPNAPANQHILDPGPCTGPCAR